MIKTLAAAALAGAVLLTAQPSAAATYSTEGVSAKEVAAVLKAKGLPVEITTDSGGDPMIKSASNDINWLIYFYDCTNDRCTSIQFTAGFDLDDGITYAKANEWNFTKRFGRAALDDEMDPYVRYDIDTAKGYSSGSMGYALETWLLIVPAFADFIGW